MSRACTDRMQHSLLDQDLCLGSLSSFFPVLISLSNKRYSLSCPNFVLLVALDRRSYSAATSMWMEKVASLSYFFSFIPGHLYRGRIKVVWVLGLRTANVTLHFPNF